MNIRGVEGLTPEQLRKEIEAGGRFVIYLYCVSILVMTFRRSSDIYFIRADRHAWIEGFPWTLLTFVVGWWGFPWGLIYTPHALFVNLRGGRDVTEEVVNALLQSNPAAAEEYWKGVPQNPW